MVHLLWNEVKSGMIRGAEKEHLKENLNRKTGQTQVIHERLTLVFYKKD